MRRRNSFLAPASGSLAVACSGALMGPLNPTTTTQWIFYGGMAGVLLVVVVLLVTDFLVTGKSADRRVQAVTEAKDREITELRKTAEQAFALAHRNAGSQEAQVRIADEATRAVLALLAQHLGQPSAPLPLPPSAPATPKPPRRRRTGGTP